MKNILLIFFLFLCYNVVAQQRFPTGVPTQFSTGWFKQGYQQSDSGTIVANRDTTWKPKYSGTIVFKPSDKKFYYFDSTVLAWFPLVASALDTTSLSNRINLKLNISDTTGKWLAQTTRLVDTIYRVNDSTVGYTIKGNPYTFQILGSQGGGGGSGTVTSVGLSMPSAFTVIGSPITTNGTISISGAGTSADYIRGNGTLATTDTGMIPNFHLKVRSLITGTSPITFNQTNGQISISNANTTGQKGAATFNNSDFIDNGSGLISLRNPSGGGGVDTIFRTPGVDSIYFLISGTQYAIKDSAGAGSAFAANNIGSGFRWLATSSGDFKTASNSNTITWDSISTANTLTAKVDTSIIATQFDLTLVNNGLSRLVDTTQLGGDLVKNTTINAGSAYQLSITGSGSANPFRVNSSGSGNAIFALSGSGSALYAQSNSSTAIQGLSLASGYGGILTSISNIGLYAATTSGPAGIAVDVNPSSTNTAQTILQLKRYTSGVAANNISGRIEFITEPASGTVDVTSGYIESGWEDATFATRKSFMALHTTFNGSTTRKANLASTGQWIWDGYPALTAQVDTTTYKPVAIDGSGNVVKMAGWAGSGGSFTTNNIGTGFAWVATPSGNIKRVANSNTISWDSTSTANSLTAKVDTSVVATQNYVNTNASVITSQEGMLYSESSWSSLSAFTNRGATASIVGSSIQLTGGINSFTQSIDLDTTMRERWVMHIEQKVGTVSGTSDGIGIGVRSVNPNYTPGIAGILITNNTGNAGKLLLLDITAGGTVIASSSNAISFSAGDTVVFELERDLFTFTLRGYNKTTGGATNTTSVTYSVAPSPTYVLPNTGTFSVFSVGGTQLITALSVLSKETKRAPLMCLGDSKTVGYYSSNLGRYSSLASYYFGPTITHAGSADRLNELLETTDEVLAIKPINATISIGSNDIAYGASVAQVFANYKQYVTILQNGGINVFHLLPFYQPTIVAELDSLADSIRITYPASNVIDCRTPMRECPSCYLSGDNVHPNAAGDSLIAMTIINSGLLRNYYKSPSVSDNPTLDIVLFNGNTSTREAKTGHLYVNTTSAYDVESFTLNGSGFLQKDQNANTFWVIKNATSGAAAAASTTLYNNNSDYLQEAIYSSGTNPVGDILAGSSYTMATSAVGHSIAVTNGPLKFLTTQFLTEKARLNQSGEFQIGSTTDQGAYTLQNTGGLYQNGSVTLNIGSDATGDIYYRNSGGAFTRLPIGSTNDVLTVTAGIPAWAAPSGGATTIYNGDGSLGGNRVVTGGGNDLSFTGIDMYTVASNYLVQAKTDGSRTFSSIIGITSGNYWQFGYTTGAGNFTRGNALVADTLNNVGLGDVTQANMPLYSTGNSTYIAAGLQSKQGNFYAVTNVTTNTTIGLTANFITVDATTGNVTITLPAASAAFGSGMGIDYVFKRLDNSGNTITIQRAGSDTIDGGTSFTLTAQYEAKKLRCLSTSTWGIY